MRYRISIYRALVVLVLMPVLALAPVTSLEARDATEVALAAPNPAPAALRFGVYAGGGTGETPNAPTPTSTAVLGRLAELAGGQPLNIHPRCNLSAWICTRAFGLLAPGSPTRTC